MITSKEDHCMSSRHPYSKSEKEDPIEKFWMSSVTAHPWQDPVTKASSQRGEVIGPKGYSKAESRLSDTLHSG